MCCEWHKAWGTAICLLFVKILLKWWWAEIGPSWAHSNIKEECLKHKMYFTLKLVKQLVKLYILINGFDESLLLCCLQYNIFFFIICSFDECFAEYTEYAEALSETEKYYTTKPNLMTLVMPRNHVEDAIQWSCCWQRQNTFTDRYF